MLRRHSSCDRAVSAPIFELVADVAAADDCHGELIFVAVVVAAVAVVDGSIHRSGIFFGHLASHCLALEYRRLGCQLKEQIQAR